MTLYDHVVYNQTQRALHFSVPVPPHRALLVRHGNWFYHWPPPIKLQVSWWLCMTIAYVTELSVELKQYHAHAYMHTGMQWYSCHNDNVTCRQFMLQ